MRISLITLLAVATLGSAGASFAQQPQQQDPLAGINPEVLEIANALGVVRGSGPNATPNALNFTEFVLDSRDGGEPAQVIYSVSYPDDAVRIHYNPGAEGETVHVAKGDRAWNEDTPGINPTEVEGEVAERRAFLWLTPYGATRALVEAGDAVQIEGDEFALSTPDGELTVMVNADNRPEHIELVQGDQTYAAHFEDYRDMDGYFVFSPSTITLEVNGEEIGTYDVTDFKINPYIVFPDPELLAAPKGTGE